MTTATALTDCKLLQFSATDLGLSAADLMREFVRAELYATQGSNPNRNPNLTLTLTRTLTLSLTLRARTLDEHAQAGLLLTRVRAPRVGPALHTIRAHTRPSIPLFASLTTHRDPLSSQPTDIIDQLLKLVDVVEVEHKGVDILVAGTLHADRPYAHPNPSSSPHSQPSASPPPGKLPDKLCVLLLGTVDVILPNHGCVARMRTLTFTPRPSNPNPNPKPSPPPDP